MDYTIKKGDRFLCLANYVMDDGGVAYTDDILFGNYQKQPAILPNRCYLLGGLFSTQLNLKTK